MNTTELNNKIVERIKASRNEREKTQEDLAILLNKTRAAISDMERGKVQVSASELYLIAKLLDKPIEYFFDENFAGKELQDIIAVTRMQDKETRTNTMDLAKDMMKMYSIQKRVNKYKKGEDVPDELVKEFYEAYISFRRKFITIADTFNKIEEFLDIEIKTRGIKPSLKK